jgi:hypothetical protein
MLIALPAAAALGACASRVATDTGQAPHRGAHTQPGGHRGAPRASHPHSDLTSFRVVTERDLATLGTSASLHDALGMLRPSFLAFRGATPTVFLDGVHSGPVGMLREIPVQWVAQVRLLTASEATLRYGTTHMGAVLEVTTRRGR